MVKQVSDNEIYFLIKYTRWFKYDRDCLHLFTHKSVPVIFEPPCIKSVLWKVAKRLSYIEDDRCLKVKIGLAFSSIFQYAFMACTPTN